MTKTSEFVSLKELRENFPKYTAAVANGHSFTVLKRSKPVFKITPVADEGKWETIIDFTEIDPRGVDADELLKYL